MLNRRRLVMLPVLTLAACAPVPQPSPAGSAAPPAAVQELIRLQERHREPTLTRRRFTHAELWGALTPVVDGSAVLTREEIGRSAEGRPIHAVRYGQGSTRVLLWSQMHGDESTATMALADVLRFLAATPDDSLARRLAERLTVVMVPMLNPDGAERFQRRNAFGIDVNRDARMLATPEARALREIQQRFRPEFGFNLHDQNVRTRVGRSDRLAAIALLAPPPDASGADTPGLLRAKQVAAVVRNAVEPLVAGHIARYDDTFNPRAFGDLMQSWGVSTVLIESGGWRGDTEKQYLRQVNFVAVLAALDAIATGEYRAADVSRYASLPPNGPAVNDLVVRGGQLVVEGMAPVRADLSVNFEDALLRTDGRVADVGDLTEVIARDTLDARGLFVHPHPEALRAADGEGFGPGVPASFTLRRGPAPDSPAVWVVEAGVAREARS